MNGSRYNQAVAKAIARKRRIGRSGAEEVNRKGCHPCRESFRKKGCSLTKL